MTFLFNTGLTKPGSLGKRFVTSFNWDVSLLVDINEPDWISTGGVWDTDTLLLIKFLLIVCF